MDGGTETKPEKASAKKPHQRCTLRTGSSRPKRWPNINSIRRTEDSEQPKQCLQGGNNIVVLPLPDPMMDLGFPSVLEAGEHEQGHDDASKKVTTSTGVAVVSNMQGFRPGLLTTPKSTRQAHKEPPFSTPPARGALERQLAE